MSSAHSKETCPTLIVRDKDMEAGYRIINATDALPTDLVLDEIPTKKSSKAKQNPEGE